MDAENITLSDADMLVLRQLELLGPAVIDDCSSLLRLHAHALASFSHGAWTITRAGRVLLHGGPGHETRAA